MKFVITGKSGTVGRALNEYLSQKGHTIVGWDRSKVSIFDYAAMEAFLKEVKPDGLYHLAVPSSSTGIPNESWTVNYQWTSELAWLCRVLEIPFYYTSTVMVFSAQAKGPFTPESRPDAYEGYGYEKRMAEERVLYQNPDARIIRLGWQIGHEPGSNTMVDYLERKMKSEGIVAASTRWLPACSYLEDTVQILDHLRALPPGIYLFDTNERWSFYQIAFAINRLEKRTWNVVASDNYVYDQRMQDPRLPRISLKSRLTTLS